MFQMDRSLVEARLPGVIDMCVCVGGGGHPKFSTKRPKNGQPRHG